MNEEPARNHASGGQKRSPGPRRRAGSRVQLQPQCHLSLVPCLRSRTSMNLNQRPSHSTRVRFRAATSDITSTLRGLTFLRRLPIPPDPHPLA